MLLHGNAVLLCFLFYEHSQSLIGICRDVASKSSRTLTLDLTKFDPEDDAESAGRGEKRSREPTNSVSNKRRSFEEPTSPVTQ
jgi:hypothetical protein